MGEIDDFLSYLAKEKRYSNNTIEAYRRDLTDYAVFLSLSECNLRNADYKMVRKWMKNLAQRYESARTINRKLSALKSFYKYLLKTSKIKENPMLKIIHPKQPKVLPVFFSEEEMGNLFNKVEFGSGYEGVRDKTILEIFYATGMRCSELVGLKHANIDLNSKTIRVFGKGKKERLIPITDQLAEVLENYLKIKAQNFNNISANSSLFITMKGEPVYRELIYRVVQKYFKQVSALTKMSPHVIRHTFATHLLNHGADINAIKSLLGHSSLAATQVYVHTSVEQLKKIYNQAHPRA